MDIKDNEDLYYLLGLHKYNWVAKNYKKKRMVDNKFNIDPSSPREGIIRYAKKSTPPPLPDDEELIKREDWDLKGLIGETELQLLHPHYWMMEQCIQSRLCRRHNILIVFECSNSKPYSNNRVLVRNFLSKYGRFADFACISNPGVIPMEYSHFYPYRYDEWDHFAEKEDIATKYCWVNKIRLINYVKEKGYKHVFVVMQNNLPQRLFNEMEAEGKYDWLHVVTNDAFRQKLKDEFLPVYKNAGMLISRTLLSSTTKNAVNEEFLKWLEGDEKKEFIEYMKILNDHSRSDGYRTNKIKKWNEMRGVKGVDITKGLEEEFIPNVNIDNEMLNVFISYFKAHIQKIYDEMDNYIGEKETLLNRLIFTPLDILMLYYKDKECVDVDRMYWTMVKAMRMVAREDTNLVRVHKYVYYYKKLETFFTPPKIEKFLDKKGLIQLTKRKKKIEYMENIF